MIHGIIKQEFDMRYVFPNSKIASSIAKTISYVTEYPLTICQKEVALLTGYRTWNELNVFHSPKNHYISYEMIKDNINKTNLIKKIIKYRSLTYLGYPAYRVDVCCEEATSYLT
jgi:hypothetical protein